MAIGRIKCLIITISATSVSVVVTDSTSTKQLQVFTNLEMLQPAVSTRAVDNQWELNDMIGISLFMNLFCGTKIRIFKQKFYLCL